MLPLKATLSQSTRPLSAAFRRGCAAQSAGWGRAAAGSSLPSAAGDRKLSGPPSQPACSSAAATPAVHAPGRAMPPAFQGSPALQKSAHASLLALLSSTMEGGS